MLYSSFIILVYIFIFIFSAQLNLTGHSILACKFSYKILKIWFEKKCLFYT